MATSEVVRRAIEEVRRICQEPPTAVGRQVETRRFQQPTELGSPAPLLGQTHTRLYSLLGRKVQTPAGVGLLWQVFEHHSGVLLDRDARKMVTYVPTSDIRPVSLEPL